MKRQWSFTENVSISNDVNFSPHQISPYFINSPELMLKYTLLRTIKKLKIKMSYANFFILIHNKTVWKLPNFLFINGVTFHISNPYD